MQRVEDFQRPEVIPDQAQETQYEDEWSDRYGILVGGTKESQWNGIGENSVGHHLITRRVWMPFTRLRVGLRPDSEEAINMPANSVQMEWSTNPSRLGMKSPRACAGDVLAAFGAQGYCVPAVLVGHLNPQELTEKVWPREIRDKLHLFEHIVYFEGFQTNDEKEAKLAEQLLQACYMSRAWIQEYVRTIKNELDGEKGLKGLNDPLKELFREIDEPLPEHKTALVAAEMGKSIVSAQQTDGRKDDAIIGALNAITSRLEKIESGTPLAIGSDPETKEASGGQETAPQTSRTSTRRQSVMTK